MKSTRIVLHTKQKNHYENVNNGQKLFQLNVHVGADAIIFTAPKCTYILWTTKLRVNCTNTSGCQDVGYKSEGKMLCHIDSTLDMRLLCRCQLCINYNNNTTITTDGNKKKREGEIHKTTASQFMDILLWQRNFMILHSTHEWMSAFGCIPYFWHLLLRQCCHRQC